MDLRVSLSAPHASPAGGLLGKVASVVRYRFFLYAGLLPYLMGGAWAYAMLGAFSPQMFWIGLLGILFSVIGVETFNEYFDSRMGTDRVFDPTDAPPMSDMVMWAGIAAFAVALGFGVYLMVQAGWPILLYAGLGGMAAVFYVAPPIRWAYRGLGETVIALSYGPLMVLGSVYLHAPSLDLSVIGPALAASLVPGCLIMGLAVTNAIPDFHQDRLVGKRNLVVRLGRERAVVLYNGLSALALVIAGLGVAAGLFPVPCLIALAAAPLVMLSYLRARHSYASPRAFVPAVRAIVQAYLVAASGFTLGLLVHAWTGI